MCNSIFNNINMTMTQVLMFLIIFGYMVYADSPFKPCNPDDPIYKSIEIMKGCNSTPCPFRRGSNFTISASFIPEENHKQAYIIMYFDLKGLKINYEGEHHANVCGNIYSYPDKVKIGCPIEKGKRYIYERSTRILSHVPKLPKLTIHWAIRDQDTKKDIVCYDITGKLV